MWNLKNGTNELIYKTEIESIDVENKHGYRGGKGMGGIHWEIGLTYTHYYI